MSRRAGCVENPLQPPRRINALSMPGDDSQILVATKACLLYPSALPVSRLGRAAGKSQEY